MSSSNGFRLSPQQAHLWTQLAPDFETPFRTRCVVELQGEMDEPRLERAVREVLSRHEILRTTYRRLPGTGAAVQVPGDVPATVLQKLDWSRTSTWFKHLEIWFDGDLEKQLLEDAPLEPEEPGRLALAACHDHRFLLLVDLPALSADRRSLDCFIRELAKAYAAQGGGEPLPEPPMQYADVSEVFQQLLESEDSRDGRRHWEGFDLSGLATVRLPERRPGAPERLFNLDRWKPSKLPPGLSAAVRAAARRIDVPVQTFVLACWQLLLARLSGRPEWSVAVRFDGRTYEGLDEAMGLFERYLPLRCEVRAHSRFADFAREVARATQDTIAWQEYFDVVKAPFLPFAFEDFTWPEKLSQDGLTFIPLRLNACTSRFELKLLCGQRQEMLDLEIHWDTARYSGDKLGERLLALLEAAAAEPERTLESLPVMVWAELRQLESFNRTERPYDTAGSIPERFAAVARSTPDALAVAFEDEQLTFSQLASRAHRLAWHLRSLGVGPETRVGLFLERSVEQIVALLAILQAGGAFVPLDPLYPRERLGSMLQQADARLVVTRSHLQSLLPEDVARAVLLDSDAERISSAPDTAPDVTVRPQQLAYVLFTSGSTGRPKGVMIQHRSLLNLAATLRDTVYEGRGPGLRVSLNGPLVFDTSVKQWVQFLNGHSLHIVPEEARLDASRMRGFVQRQALDALDTTPSLLAPLLEQGLGRDPDFSPALVLVGGEAIDARTWTELRARSRTRFVNMYGPTECTVNSTTCPVAASPEPTIGGPLGNVRVHLLDAYLRPVPPGIPGELYIGGAGVGRGYIGRPELTAERFIPDPAGTPGSRLYRTGDLGRWREDGRIEFLGRADHQVKLRGLRIELGEIEAVMRTHPEVGEVIVVLRETQPGEQHLVGYFVPRRGLTPGAEAEGQELANQLRGLLRRMLPEFMVPWALVPLARLPLTRNGKVDRAALPNPSTAARESDVPYEAPTNQIEQTIAAIWQEALKVDKVGLHSNFFDLGGHSLLMVQVHEKLAAAFGRRFSMVELFQHPTVAALARHIGQAQGGATAASGQSQQRVEDRAQKQRQALQQQALLIKAGRGRK
ncbi:non-ribosomal peptide synthetase [Archangium lansingense]|uniref:non-ribosomal peptide synthetase n=1 Tax=Archangium lansingense TaxID=2995310 RepID=UPI003B77EB79